MPIKKYTGSSYLIQQLTLLLFSKKERNIRFGNSHFLILSLCILFLGASCKVSKNTAIKSVKRMKPEMLVDEMISKQVKAKQLEGKMKLKFSDEYQTLRGTGTVKMIKDSVIWMNVKALGFEVGRALITQDSFFMLFRLQKEYIAEPLSYVEELYNVPANLSILQTIILGNPVFFQTSGFEMQPAELSYHLFGKNDSMESNYWLNNVNLSLEKMSFDDFRSGRTIDMKLENYAQTTENQNFSYFRNLELFSKQTGKISVDIDFIKLDLNIPTDIKFEIPERYERVE